MLDILLLVVFGITTWCVSGEGVWGGALVLLSVLFSGLLAMNFFEPLTEALFAGGPWETYGDFVCLVGIFAVSVTALRFITDSLMPVYIEVLPLMYDIGRWACGAAAGYLLVGFLGTALHTAPLPREFLGWAPEQKMLFGIGPDHQWLAFTQYVSENVYTRGRIFDGERAPAVPEAYRTASGPQREQLLETWSSFPMRYAYRREQNLLGGDAAAPATPSAPAPPAPGSPGTPDF